MQSVADRWYIIYSRLATLVAAVFAVGYFVARFVPGMEFLSSAWGFTDVTLALAVLQLLYVSLVYPHLTSRGTYWGATLGLSMIFALNILQLIHTTGMLSSWYLALWVYAVLTSAIFGWFAAGGTSFLMSIYFVITTMRPDGELSIEINSTLALAGTYLLSIISYILWRPHYTQEESRVAQLTGALKSKQQQAEILIQSISDGVIVTGTDGKISLMNPAAAAMTQWSINEAIGVDVNLVAKLATEKNGLIEHDNSPFTKVLREKQGINETLLLIGRNGEKIAVSLAISPVVAPNSQETAGVVAVLRDVSKKQAEEERRAEFISTASHEMRTPVAAIEGYLALALNEQVSKIDSNARSYLEKAHASTQHLGQLFQDLLTSAKAEDGRLVNDQVVVEVGAFLEQIIDTLRFAAEKKGLKIEFLLGTNELDGETKDGRPKVIKPLYYTQVDPDRMREVITNLFDNAVKYTEAGKITIGLTGDKDVVQIYIKDTGSGIPPEDLPHLFQKFYRVDNSSTRTIGGTGLGLFISKKIIDLYNGRIWAESKLGEGSTFYINIPRLTTLKARDLQAAEASSIKPGLK